MGGRTSKPKKHVRASNDDWEMIASPREVRRLPAEESAALAVETCDNMMKNCSQSCKQLWLEENFIRCPHGLSSIGIEMTEHCQCQQMPVHALPLRSSSSPQDLQDNRFISPLDNTKNSAPFLESTCENDSSPENNKEGDATVHSNLDDESDDEAGIVGHRIDARITCSGNHIRARNIHLGPQFNVTAELKHMRRNRSNLLPDEEKEMTMQMEFILRKQYQKMNSNFIPNHYLKSKICLESCLELCFKEVKYSADSIIQEQSLTDDILMNCQKFGEMLQSTSNVSKISKVHIKGQVWYGKTVFCHQVLRDWANMKSESLKAFQLAFYIQGKNYCSLKDALLMQVKEIDREANDKICDDDLYHIIRNHSSKVLIFIDGLQDVPTEFHNELSNLVSNKIFPQATVIVTSRPNTDTVIDPGEFQKEFLITGFSSSQITSYLQKSFQEDSWKNLLRILQEHSINFMELFACPFLMLLFFHVTNHEMQLQIFPSITQFFKSIFLMALGCEISVEWGNTNLFQNKVLVNFGKECYEAYLKNKGRLTNLNFGCKKLDAILSLLRNSSNRANKITIEFTIALYLHKNLELNSFKPLLQNYIKQRNKSGTLILRFLVGLAEEKVANIYNSLPWSYFQDIFFLFNLLKENCNDEHLSCLVTKLPNWIDFKINSGYTNISQPIDSINVLNDSKISLSSMGNFCTSFVTVLPKWYDMLKHPECGIQQLSISIDDKNCISSFECAYQILMGLENNCSLTSLTIDLPRVTVDTIQLVLKLNLANVTHLYLHADSFDEKVSNVVSQSHNSLSNLSSFHLTVKHFPQDHVCGYVDNVLELLEGFNRLHSLVFKPIKSINEINKLANFTLEKNIHHLSFEWNPNQQSPFPISSKSANAEPVTMTTRPFNPLDKIFQSIKSPKSTLASLNLSGSVITDIDAQCLFHELLHSGCTSLSLANCIHPRTNSPLTVNLTLLTPPNKQWKYVNFKGWNVQFNKQQSKNLVGQIDTLKIYLATTNFDIFELAEHFSIRQLHSGFDQNTVTHVRCKSLEVLKLELPLEDKLPCVITCLKFQTHVRMLKLKSNNLMGLHKILEWHQILLSMSYETIAFYLPIWQPKYRMNLIVFLENVIQQSQHLQNLTLSIHDQCKELWQNYIDPILTFVSQALNVNNIRCITFTQPLSSYLTFVENFEIWQNDNDNDFEISSHQIPSKAKIILSLRQKNS